MNGGHLILYRDYARAPTKLPIGSMSSGLTRYTNRSSHGDDPEMATVWVVIFWLRLYYGSFSI